MIPFTKNELIPSWWQQHPRPILFICVSVARKKNASKEGKARFVKFICLFVRSFVRSFYLVVE
jgi:hypothetical protein